MPSVEARIPTDRATRYLEQLCSHLGALGHMRHVPASGHGGHGHGGQSGHGERSEQGERGVPQVVDIERSRDRAVIRFAGGCWDLTAGSEALVLRVEAETAASLEQLTAAITARIAKIGRRDGLKVTWSASGVQP